MPDHQQPSTGDDVEKYDGRADTPRAWPDIRADLQRPIPERLLDTKHVGGQDITFVPWHRAQKILDHYTGGWWEKSITEKRTTDEHFLVTVEVTVIAQKKELAREGTGLESLDTDSWGDFQSNAESMAFRRACAAFGLGLDLYEEG
jgi:hypothetical protein